MCVRCSPHCPRDGVFLRAPASEARAVAQVVEAYALAYPEVAFRLLVDERRVLTTDGSGDARAAFAAVHGAPLAAELLPMAGERTQEESHAAVEGLVGPPHVHRANRRILHLFANGRAINSRTLTYAIEQAYAGRLPGGRYPVGLIHIVVPPDQIDVNVHPTKAEVRFRQERFVYGTVASAVHAALNASGIPNGPSFGDATLTSSATHDIELGAWPDPALAPWAAARAIVAGAQAPAHRAGLGEQDGSDEAAAASVGNQAALGLHARLPALRALGQLDATYLVAEAADGLMLIDQHAAHERVLYEQVCAARASGQVLVQPLLTAVLAPLSAGQAAVAVEQADALAALGFTIEPTDGAAVLLRALPAALASNGDPARTFAEYLDRLADEDDRRPGAERTAATLACRAAVMAGDRMDIEQQRALLRALEQCESPQTCPHGRPTTLHLATTTLARSFGRR
jgi:DNA mismatch repair protein MutL